MSSLHLRHHPGPLSTLLLTGAVVALLMGLLIRVVLPDGWDPWWARLSIAAACAAMGAMARRRRHLAQLQTGLRALAWAASAWVVLLLWGNDFPSGLSSGVVVVQAVCLVVFPSMKEALLYTLALSVGLILAGSWAGVSAQAYVGLASTTLAVGVVMAQGTRHRIGLAEALLTARDRLEDQVDERTRELKVEVGERRRAEVRALDASAAKSRFLANMSHELRTPLNAILGYTELVEETVTEGPFEPAVVCTDLHTIRRSGHHLLALVDDVLDLSRIEAGSLDLALRPVDVSALVAQAVDEIRPVAEGKGLALRTHVPPTVPQAYIDAQRAAQILMNLLSNAVKFTASGTVEVSVHARPGAVAIEVRDTGVGISDDGRERLFTPFGQLDDTSTRTAGGTGLGLALSRDLAHQMGGEISVQSVPGSGSTFTLLVPSADGDRLPEPSLLPSAYGAHQVMGIPRASGACVPQSTVADHTSVPAVSKATTVPEVAQVTNRPPSSSG